MLGHLAPQIGGEDSEQRLALAGSQILGLVFARYVLKVPQVADLSVQDIAGAVGPTLDRYLSEDLNWGNNGGGIEL